MRLFLVVCCGLMAALLSVSPFAMAEAQTEANATESQKPVAGRVLKPRWEVGLVGGYFNGYDYPASKDRNQRTLALPYFIYRTPRVRFGDGGLKAVAIENPRIKLDISIGGSLNASSEGEGIRRGMPDLDFLFEFGPQLEVKLLEQNFANGARLLARFSTELRAVFATDFSSIDSVGGRANAGFGLVINNINNSGMGVFSSLQSTWGTEKLQDYFYEVPDQYQTPDRPAFDATAGYLSSRWFAGVAFQPTKHWRMFVGGYTSVFDGAANEGSPLFETTSQSGYIVGVVWNIKSSKEMVEIVDLGADR